jgi:hypothetical protein
VSEVPRELDGVARYDNAVQSPFDAPIDMAIRLEHCADALSLTRRRSAKGRHLNGLDNGFEDRRVSPGFAWASRTIHSAAKDTPVGGWLLMSRGNTWKRKFGRDVGVAFSEGASCTLIDQGPLTTGFG